MITGTQDVQTLWGKLSFDIAVQPIVCTEITNENDMLKPTQSTYEKDRINIQICEYSYTDPSQL